MFVVSSSDAAIADFPNGAKCFVESGGRRLCAGADVGSASDAHEEPPSGQLQPQPRVLHSVWYLLSHTVDWQIN